MANAIGKKDGLFQRMSRFVHEAVIELRKTSWPTYEELKKSTALVLLAVAIVTIFIGGFDYLLGMITRRLVGW